MVQDREYVARYVPAGQGVMVTLPLVPTVQAMPGAQYWHDVLPIGA
jgi:hypothetical protein